MVVWSFVLFWFCGCFLKGFMYDLDIHDGVLEIWEGILVFCYLGYTGRLGFCRLDWSDTRVVWEGCGVYDFGGGFLVFSSMLCERFDLLVI